MRLKQRLNREVNAASKMESGRPSVDVISHQQLPRLQAPSLLLNEYENRVQYGPGMQRSNNQRQLSDRNNNDYYSLHAKKPSD
jgi:hypothetical protein